MSRLPWWTALSEAMTTAPVLQIAGDGDWELAKVTPIAAGQSQANELMGQVVQKAQSDVAVEILWPDQAFVGVRWSVAEAQAANDAIDRAYAALHDQHHGPRSKVVEAGLLALLGSVPSLDLEFVELGALNAWKTVGPERLWQRGGPSIRQALDALPTRRPDLVTCAHPLAVELAVDQPRPCWIGILVSTGSGPVHHLNDQRLSGILDRIT